MNKTIVITSIFQPTIAVQKFSAMRSYELIVAGDKKTPTDWQCDNAIFLSVDEQVNMDFNLPKKLPFNHYCRKMTGYLKAIESGADIIIDTDDDNIPNDDWAFPECDKEYDCINNYDGFINIYQLYTKQKIWPRGLPLRLIAKQFDIEKNIEKKYCKVGIWQGLANEDPDVDAIYRLTSDEPCYFNKRNPIALGNGVLSPFNSQNTMYRKELFTLLYLPTYVTFRFTDILRSLIAQPIMWLYNYQLGFVDATVVQKRNPHDYMKDFVSEIPMYEHCEKVAEIVSASVSATESMESNLYNAYNSLLKTKIVSSNEMITLEAWLKDIDKLKN